MSLIDGISNAVGDFTNVLDSVSDLAQNPLVDTALKLGSPLTMGLTSISIGGSVLDSLFDEMKKQQECGKPANQRRGRGEDKEGGSAEGGGSVFERIAVAMGEAMDKKLQQLLAAADEVASLSNDLAKKADGNGVVKDKDKFEGEGGIMKASAQVTARGQELNAISQAFNSAINSLGQAASNAARKA
jgi:hypothetical protein